MPLIPSFLLHHLRILGLTLLQLLQRTIITTKQSRLFSPATQPDKTLFILPQRRRLVPTRIFTPRYSGIDGKHDTLPLIIMVHGGGFMMNRPCVDDAFARFIADTCGCVVAGIDYRKAPTHPFPAGYEDVVESVLALLDGAIPEANTSKVILVGTASGGNLVLGAAQDSRLQGKITGVVSIAPVVNLVPSKSAQMATRPDPNIPDALESWYDILLDVYARTKDGEMLSDVRLSPAFFRKREDLPGHVLLVGLEHDLLCFETRRMAERLAGEEERVAMGDGWRAGGVGWMMVRGQIHGFGKVKGKEDSREEAKRRMEKDVAEWIVGALKDGER